MASLIPNFEYDIFISYRHNDNRSGWVTEFVEALKQELAATLKEPISIYFDTNPHDGLLENHDVDKSLERKLKCIIFIPIISQTYCDPKSFAWQHEFVAFNKLAKEDSLGRDVLLRNGNVANRILPIKIHELDAADTAIIEKEIERVLRAIEFIYKEPGVNRPLTLNDDKKENLNNTDYRNQTNKVANAVKEIIQALKINEDGQLPNRQSQSFSPSKTSANQKSYKKPGIAIAVSLVLAVVLYFAFFSSKDKLQEQKPLSIAVLPFRSTSGNAAQEDYGIGLANEIRTKLSESKHFLYISSLQSTIAYANSTDSPVKIGSDLEVNYLLSGIYQLSGDRIKIDVELIDTQTGHGVWNLSFNRLFDDIFEIQANIASKVYSQFSLIDNQSKELPTKNLEAYGHYLRAQELFWSPPPSSRTKDTLAEAIEQLNLAIQLDSSFLEAYLDMTYVKARLTLYYKQDNPLKYNQIKNEVELLAKLVHQRFPVSWKTINMDAHITYVLYEDYDEALKLFQEVLTHDPENFLATAFIGAIHKRKLMQAEALKYDLRARQLDPAAAGMWNEIAQIYFSMGDYVNMETSVEKAINLGHSLGYNFSEPQQTQFYFHSTGRKIPGTHLPLLENTNERFFQRDFKGMTHIYDSVFAATKQTSSEGFYWKSVAYYMLQRPDSLQKYVKLTLADKAYEANGRTFMLYAMIGDKDNAIHALEEYRKDQEHEGQDTWGMANTMRDHVLLLSLLGDYKGATNTLIKLNETYPTFGDYEFIRVSPFYDKVKKEYPPFADGLKNLKLPPKISMEEVMKL